MCAHPLPRGCQWIALIGIALLVACAPRRLFRDRTRVEGCELATKEQRTFSTTDLPSLAGRFFVLAKDTANTWEPSTADTVTLRIVDASLAPQVAEWRRFHHGPRATDPLPRLVSPAFSPTEIGVPPYFDWRVFARDSIVRGVERTMHPTPTTYKIEWISARGFGGRWKRPFGQIISSPAGRGYPRPYAGVYCAVRAL